MSLRWSALFVALLFAACGTPPSANDGGVEPELDSGSVDAGEPPDAGDLSDAGADDAGLEDAGRPPNLDTWFLSAPSGLVASSAADFSFSSNDPAATFECSLDGIAWASCSSPQSYLGFGEGAHVFYVRAVSTSGKRDKSPAVATWIVDTSPPSTQLLSAPTEDLVINVATFTFDSRGEKNPRFICSLDSAPATPCSSPWVISGLSSGFHTFSVAAKDEAGNVDTRGAFVTFRVLPGNTRVRIMAANTTSGNNQSYDPGEGIRMFQGLKPDVALVQEMKFGTNTDADLRTFIDTAFGTEFSYFRETGGPGRIPNGVVSRWPILASGSWDDPLVAERDFAWARIDLPGAKDLWAISVHLLTSSSSSRNTEATSLRAFINANVPAGDYLVIGGDFNTDTRTESCITTLANVVVTSSSQAPYPVDQGGNSNTNTNRNKPYDWVLADPDLNPLRIPVVIGNSSYASGLVLDSRVYSPLSEVSPVQFGDSAATNMQHMPVVKDFRVPY